MKNILNYKKQIFYLVWVLVIIIMAFTVVTSDNSQTQAEQPIEVELSPCEIIDSAKVEVEYFNKGAMPYICGKILSEFLPLELQFILTDKQSGERVYYEVKKLVDYDFLIELPNNLDVGKYEFEVKTAHRHFGIVVFEVVE